MPRTIAASVALSLRAGSGSRTLPPTMPGRSAAKPTQDPALRRSLACSPSPSARLNGSVGLSLAVDFGLMWEDMTAL